MTPLAYCTNVHAGADLEQTRANVERYAPAVRRLFSPDRVMGLGLWLSASSARQLLAEDHIAEWRDWLARLGLVPFTFNGFPYGDFHQRVVKHRVYHPTWFHPDRLRYTLDLIEIQHGLLPAGVTGSISTLPIAWGEPSLSESEWQSAASALVQAAHRLARLEAETGRMIRLCLESEPGCVLQRSGDLVRFFERFLLRGDEEKVVCRHLGICHDICHQAIMFEDQAEVLGAYRNAGIAIGKVQVSSAVRLPLDRLAVGEHAAAVAQLAEFVEERYLHQTVIRMGKDPIFFEDLPLALARGERAGDWRVHFHVPIYLERFGRLETTQFAIRECLRAVSQTSDCRHFEVETYAWGVLPAELQQPDLPAGIAAEMRWLAEEMKGNPTSS
jgi:sugar phosphate isomerase/epimerase